VNGKLGYKSLLASHLLINVILEKILINDVIYYLKNKGSSHEGPLFLLLFAVDCFEYSSNFLKIIGVLKYKQNILSLKGSVNYVSERTNFK
jgi:hypothetical protein